VLKTDLISQSWVFVAMIAPITNPREMKFSFLFVVILVLLMDEKGFSQEPNFKGPVVYLEVAGAA